MIIKEIPLAEMTLGSEIQKKTVLPEPVEFKEQPITSTPTPKQTVPRIDFEYVIEKSGKIELSNPKAFACRNEGRELVACEGRFLKSFTLEGSSFPNKIFTVGNSQISVIEEMSQDKYALGNVDGEVFLFDYSFGVVNSGLNAHFNTINALCNLPNLVI